MESIIISVILVILGYISGKIAESRHYRSIEERERKFSRIPVVTLQNVLDDGEIPQKSWLVAGSVVVSLDYFKKILALLRTLFGGEVSAYETLLDRARREAVLRMKEQAKGADVVFNVRIETSSIGKNANQENGIGGVEVLAYGTAITLEK